MKQTSSFWTTRLLFQRGLAFIYTIGFLIIINQYVPLLGKNGLIPIKLFMQHTSFWSSPSIFWLNASDMALFIGGWIGLGLATTALSGISEKFGNLFSAFVWFCLWLLYLSYVNLGYIFYGFGWESILLETGFLAIFLGSQKCPPPAMVIWLLRWVLFRVMFGAGLIKLRGDSCWLDLTCMNFHYETQPVPGPLSWHFHHLPIWYHKLEVLYTHFVELIVPWGYFFAGFIAVLAGLLTILFQLVLILSGNLSWLNYMTLVLCIPCLDDCFLQKFRLRCSVPEKISASLARKVTIILLGLMIAYLSRWPIQNMISKNQVMNTGFNPFHLVNTYGAFGSVTRIRHEVILEGTADDEINEQTVWKEYEFKCKPGDVTKQPCIMSPYHYRLDWQIWFAAMSGPNQHPWLFRFIANLLKNDPNTLNLIRDNPFTEKPPHYIRAQLYEYHFTNPEERAHSGQWWKRKLIGPYIPPISA